MQKDLAKPTAKATPKYPIKSQVQEILAVIVAFSDLLQKETAALKKSDFKTVDTLQTGKKLFARQYHAKVTALAEHKEQLPGLDLLLREKLVKERTRFNTVLEDNMHALEVAQNSTKRLVNRILDAARSAVMKDHETNYSSTGKTMAYKSASKSLAVDQSL